MFSWYAQLTHEQKRAFWACYGGWSLDGFDVQLYTFLIAPLISLWHMTNSEAGIIASSSLITSAVGGWAAGILSDRYGRVRMLQITILWYSVFTAACGLTNSFGELLMMRSLQGIGFGGEWTVGAILIGEIVQASNRGRAVGSIQSGWAVGWGLAAVLATFALSTLPPSWGWRALFLVGVAPALLIFYIRRYVNDSRVFLERSAAQKETLPTYAGRIFSRDLLRTTILCSLLSTGALGGYYAVMTWLPTYLRVERGLTVVSSGLYLGIIIFGAFVGYLFGAYLSDIIGRRRTFLVYSIGCIALLVSYTLISISNETMLLLGFPLGFCAVGVFSAIGPFFTELFPTVVRGSGQGFAYNAGRAAGAFFPVMVGFLSSSMSLGRAVGVFGAIAYSLLMIAAYSLPETKGKELDTISGGSQDGVALCNQIRGSLRKMIN